MKSFLSVGAVVLAGCLWGMISLFVRPLSEAGASPLAICVLRLATATPLLFLFLFLYDKTKLKIRLRDIPLFIGTGIVSMVLFNVCYFYTMTRGEASVAVVLLYTSPAFILLIGALLFRERITAVRIAALILMSGGLVLVTKVTEQTGAITPILLATGLCSGFFYALYTVFARVALTRYETLTVTAYTFLFAFAGSVGALLCMGESLPAIFIGADALRRFAESIGIGVLCTALPYALYTKGLTMMESGKAAILAAVEPMVGAVIGMTVFGEPCDAAKLCGIGLILGAILLLSKN